MSCRTTRGGTQFSPYEIDIVKILATSDYEVVETDIDLDDILEDPLVSDAHRSDQSEEGAVHSDSDPDAWIQEGDSSEDGLESPLSSVPGSPSPSPLCEIPSPPPSSTPTIAVPPATSPKSSFSTPLGSREQARQAEYNKQKRKKKRAGEAEARYTRYPQTKHSQMHRIITETTSFDAMDLPSSSNGGWFGHPDQPKKRKKRKSSYGKKRRRQTGKLLTKEELLNDGCRLVKWEGKRPLLILDKQGRIIAVFIGTPEDPDWPKVIHNAVEALTNAREKATRLGLFSKDDRAHRRGNYSQLTEAVTLGPGQAVGGFANFGPKLFEEYIVSLEAIFQSQPELPRNFSNSIYPAVTFNLGPEAITFQHMDFKNLAHGWCGITCGGRFDHKLGGHLYLKQLRLIIEFPSGSSALIPSGSVDHGNTPLQPGETRCSITQYAAAALFRWVKYGLQSGKQLLSQPGGAELKALCDGAPGERAKTALGFFSKLDELAGDRVDVFTRLQQNSP
ncbi:hypothetical protein FB451DRAFT_1472562 [Mycena latifolia]|nr:hypothetical protein FB451DRAFT_1472562 [Mycena latifolia]